MKLCSHVITVDTGLAPNPFNGYCTTAVCTPSHMNARLRPGDWLIGNSPRADGNRLVYAMHISEVLDMDTYFHDTRFQAKKPNPEGSQTEQCGDNLYYRTNDGWKRLPSRFHNDAASFLKDVGKNRAGRPVFVAEQFYYFGDNRVAIPEPLRGVIRGVQGIQYTAGRLASEFLVWLESQHTPGVNGRPRKMVDLSPEVGPMITELPGDHPLLERVGTRSRPVSPSRRGSCR